MHSIHITLLILLSSANAENEKINLKSKIISEDQIINESSKVSKYDDWIVVVHSSNPRRRISSAELRRFLLKDKIFWANNIRVVPLMLETSHERFNDLSLLFFKFSKNQYPRYWIEQKFTKGQIKPKESDSKTIIQLIGILKGGIAVIPKSDWNKLERLSVKSLDIVNNDS